MIRRHRSGSSKRGQALVEFSIVLIPFLFILMGIIDLGRGIYVNNGVSQAAREIARVTSVHPCNSGSCTLGNSTETTAVVNTQKSLVPGLADPTASIVYQCVDIRDQNLSNTACRSGDFVRVTVSVPFRVVTPLLSLAGPFTLASVSHIQLP
ncbi:MAG: pilus assembly protein [Chloroflexi bacterium]|nr:pilus assembly protein [Chloroflexota bacterium]